jgi:hypothetical protein
MSMKLDENSFNLKEEEFKGGGFGSGLPHGVSEVDSKKKGDIQMNIKKELPDVNFNPEGSLLQIKKTTLTSGIGRIGRGESETFKKFNKLFGEEKKGKSLHFLKASFFKTDENIIYTYSEHRTPKELVDDFPEYYKNVFERDIVLEVNKILSESNNLNKIKAFVTLINIIYLLFKKIKEYLERGEPLNDSKEKQKIKAYNIKELSFVKHIIDLLEERDLGSNSLKDIFITEPYKANNNNIKDIENGEKIKDKDLIDIIMSLSKNKSLKIIINKLCVLSYYLNEIIKTGKTIDIFKLELYNKLSGKDLNHNNYKYLYNAIRNNLEYLTQLSKQDFSNQIEEIKYDSKESIVGDNLSVLTKIINDVLTNFNESITKLNDDISTIITKNKSIIDEVLKQLQSTISIVVDTDEKFKSKSYIEKEVSKTMQDFTDSATTDEKTFKDTKTMEEVIIGLKGQIKQLESDFDKSFEDYKNNYETNKAESEKQNDDIIRIIEKARELSNGSTIITEEIYTYITKELNSLTTNFNSYEKLVDQVNAEAVKANHLIHNTRKNFDILKSELEKYGERVSESLVNTKESLVKINVLDKITGYKTEQLELLASIKNKYETNLTEQIQRKDAATALQSVVRRRTNIDNQQNREQNYESSYGGGGKSNTKELRKKLNTMSIKQLKRLSTKNKIEYGNKNTIKSLINNYIKHIKVN